MKFEESIFVEYPIPKSLSVWSSAVDADGEILPPEYDLSELIEKCVMHLRSDIFVSDTIRVTCQNMVMPEDTVGIRYVTLDYRFPGNKRIKYSYLKGTNVLNVIYTPSFVTYMRKLRVSDLDNLEGDRLRYFECYCLYKMLQMEIPILKGTELHTDNATINLEALEEFANERLKEFNELKPEILIYAGKF